MIQVKAMSALEPHCGTHPCQGKCPKCGGCVFSGYGFMGGTIGVYQVCTDDSDKDCDFSEVVPDPDCHESNGED